MTPPLVSCIMPTFGRPLYVAESVALFLAQDNPAKELLIGNDCPGQTMLAELPGVRVVNYPSRFPTLGEKRNALIRAAAWELLAVWDDDDIYLPWHLSQSVAELQARATPLYFPTDFWAYWGAADLHHNRTVPGWMSHGMWLFERQLWERVGGYPPQPSRVGSLCGTR